MATDFDALIALVPPAEWTTAASESFYQRRSTIVGHIKP